MSHQRKKWNHARLIALLGRVRASQQRKKWPGRSVSRVWEGRTRHTGVVVFE
ncbi:hypothetical protein [Knoellia subterranea]|uniref:hypothetical protein n=1 Tax=Knoellia subterranea TaxID=184882 RepID=UPI000AACCEB0|nr:hypothetical protein [Knoellia subterranea]